MADVVQENVPEQKLEEETVLNGDAEEKEEVDPSEETAKKKKKKKKKKSVGPGKSYRPASYRWAVRA